VSGDVGRRAFAVSLRVRIARRRKGGSSEWSVTDESHVGTGVWLARGKDGADRQDSTEEKRRPAKRPARRTRVVPL